MRTVGGRADGHRLRGPIVLLWRARLRISEALGLAENDLDAGRGSILVRRGKGVGVARSAWTVVIPASRVRVSGPLEDLAPGFVEELERKNYAPGSASEATSAMAWDRTYDSRFHRGPGGPPRSS